MRIAIAVVMSEVGKAGARQLRQEPAGDQIDGEASIADRVDPEGKFCENGRVEVERLDRRDDLDTARRLGERRGGRPCLELIEFLAVGAAEMLR